MVANWTRRRRPSAGPVDTRCGATSTIVPRLRTEPDLRVLHVVLSLDPQYGGPVTTTFGQIAALADHRGVHCVILTRRAGNEQVGDAPNCPVLAPPGLLSFLRTIWTEVGKSDAVHIHSVHRLHFVIGAVASKMRGRPYVVEPHGALSDYHFSIRHRRKIVPFLLLERPLLRGAVAIVVSSRREKEAIALRSLRNVHVLPHFIRAIHGGPIERIPGTVLYLGRITAKKQVWKLVRAFGLSADPEQTDLTIAGPADRDAQVVLESEVAKLPATLRERVHLTGPVYGDAKSALFRAHDIFVLPSLEENFGNTVIEALFGGCRLVISPDCGCIEFLDPESKALKIVDAEPEAIADAIHDLRSISWGEAQTSVADLRTSVEARLAPDRIAEGLIRFYKRNEVSFFGRA